MRPDEFLRKYGFDNDGNGREHSLRENSLERAQRLHRPNAGTPHDWEDWEQVKKEQGLDDALRDDDPTAVHHDARQASEAPPPSARRHWFLRFGDWLIQRFR